MKITLLKTKGHDLITISNMDQNTFTLLMSYALIGITYEAGRLSGNVNYYYFEPERNLIELIENFLDDETKERLAVLEFNEHDNRQIEALLKEQKQSNKG